MKSILIILILQIICLKTSCQEAITYEFVVNGIIGMSDKVPIEDIVVRVNDQSELTDNNGKFRIKINATALNIKIQHLGFREIDTTIRTNELEEVTEIDLIADCWVNKELAISDINNRKIKLLLVGGIAPSIIIGQEKVEENYKFKYKDFGCMAPAPDECIMQYNFEVFKYLDAKYGKTWRKQVRNDIIGIKEYKKED